MAFSHSIREPRSMPEAVKTSHRRVTTTTATDMATSGPIWSAARIPAARVPPSGLTSHLSNTRLRIRLETWVGIHFARIGTRMWIYRSSANSRLQNDSEWNFASRCLTRRIPQFGQSRSQAWRLQTSGRSRALPTPLDNYSSDSSFTFERGQLRLSDGHDIEAGVFS